MEASYRSNIDEIEGGRQVPACVYASSNKRMSFLLQICHANIISIGEKQSMVMDRLIEGDIESKRSEYLESHDIVIEHDSVAKWKHHIAATSMRSREVGKYLLASMHRPTRGCRSCFRSVMQTSYRLVRSRVWRWID